MYLYKTIYEFGGRGEAAAHQIFVKFDLSRIEINSEKVGNSRKNYKLVENSRKFTTTYKIINMISTCNGCN